MKNPPENTQIEENRNPGLALDERWLRHVQVNRSAVERRTATLVRRRSIKQDWQTAWYLKAISCIDLTTLSGDDTPERVRRLCRKALNPVRTDILNQLGLADFSLTTAAICVYHHFVSTAVAALDGSTLPVAAVSTEIHEIADFDSIGSCLRVDNNEVYLKN